MFDEPALASKHLDGKLAAVLTSHNPFDVFEENRPDAAVIIKLLAAIMHSDARPRADVLVICPFIGILKTSPSAHVVNQDRLEIGGTRLHFLHEGLESLTAIHS